MIRAVLFDVDGVIINSMKMHFDAWNEVLNPVGLFLTDDEYAKLGGMPSAETIDLLNEKYTLGLSAEQKELLYNKRKEVVLKKYQNLEVFEGVTEIFEYLKSQDVMITVATGMPKKRAVEVLTRLFGDIFAHITGFGDYELGKPHPDPFLIAWKKTGFKKEECIVVEDSPLGTQAAKSAGIASIGITTTVSRKTLEESHATYVVSNHVELLEKLKELLA